MTIRCSEFIPKEKFSQFHEVICATGGRYLHNPFEVGQTIHVVYSPGIDHNKLWNLYTEDVVEIRKDQKWRIFIRRFFKLNP
jgi:hypothetical protein